MKKFFFSALAITLVFSIVFLCGCGNSSTAPTESKSETESETESEITSKDLSYSVKDFLEVKPSDEYLYIYREEVKSRLQKLDEESNFTTDLEWNAIRSLYTNKSLQLTYDSITSYSGYYSDEYFYPVVYSSGNSLFLWYTNESGRVIVEELSDIYSGSTNYLGTLHCDEDTESIQKIYNSHSVIVTYDNENYIAQKWEFGKAVLSAQLPEDTVYCGFSNFEGLIFRAGSDVYSLKDNDGKPTVIAHNVKYVIDTEYRCGSDPWSQPLFLMEDGTIKVYISWEGDKAAPVDDESHLVDPYHEGSHGKFRH